MPNPSEVLKSIDFQADPRTIIRDHIIPQMDARHSRAEPMPRIAVVRRVFSTGEKPGEMIEFIDARLEALQLDKRRMTPHLASEIADILYYTLQPNCPDWLNNPTPLLDLDGVDSQTAAWFCVVKYQARIMFGDQPDYKEIEYAALTDFLTGSYLSLPEMRGNLN